MLKKTVPALLLLLASAAAAVAQPPSAREAVSSLPESQAVLVVNARRITNDALPRVLTPKQLADLDKGVADIRKQVNVDVRAVEYAVVGLRFAPDTLSAGQLPEFGLVLRGGFNADAVLSFVRLAQPSQYRPETHGGKTLDVYKIDFEGPAKDADRDPAAPTPTPPPFKLPTEIAFVSFGADEVMVGTPAYVRAAIDARAGAGRIRAELVDLALRNAESLVSVAGEMPAGLSNLLGMAGQLGAPGGSATGAVMNDEIKRLIDSVRQMQFSINMGAADFGVQTVLRTDRPEDARAISGLAVMGLGMAEQGLQKEATTAKTAKAKADARKFLGVLKSVGNDVRENEVTFSVSAPQATVAELVRQSTAPAKPAPRRAAPAKRRTVKRRG